MFVYLVLIGSVVLITFVFIHLRQGHGVLPQSRSSHEVPTPNGGAIGILLSSLLWLIYLLWPAGLKVMVLMLWPFVLSGLAGYLDDHHGLSGKMKLALTGIAIIPLLLVFSGGLSVMLLSVVNVPFFLFIPLGFLGLLWVVHLTNFMDGINGLAVLQVLFMLFATLLFRDLLLLSGTHQQFMLGVAVASVAFLPFNFPVAKVFLGDTGSLFFGTLMAWLLVVYLTSHLNGLWVFLILFAMFWVDTTVTLFQRLRWRKSIFEAHRDHAYQHLANEKWHSHWQATGFTMLVNVFWLLPLAYGALLSTVPIVWFLIAVTPVFIYVIKMRAGQSFRHGD